METNSNRPRNNLTNMNYTKKILYEYVIPVIGRFFVRRNKFINVIYYHDVVETGGASYLEINIKAFEAQMKYIASRGYETVRINDLQNNCMSYDPNKIIIAFDDGMSSNYTLIYDLMRTLGLKYNIFLAIEQIEKNPNYLSWEQINKMNQEGFVGFGVHTYSHPDMSDINNIDPTIEFDKANSIFAEHLGYKPLDFCYPFGYYSCESNDYIIYNQTYERIYTSDQMYSYKRRGKLILGRNAISGDDSFRVFKAKLKGYFNIWETLMTIKK